MTLADDIAAALPGLRAEAESRMRDTCTITREGVATFNPVTLQNESTPTVVYQGPCRLKDTVVRARDLTVADQGIVEGRYLLSLPVATSGSVRKDDTVTFTDSVTDPALVGRVYTIISGPAYADGTARRFPVRETQ